MRLYLGFFFMMILFTSCDDGEIIVTTFEFEDEALTMCSSTTRNKVLFHRNNLNVFETLSLELNSNQFPVGEQVLTTENTVTISLSGNNRIVYRTYDAEVPANYFCNPVPPANPRVLQEFISVGGTVVITTSPVFGVIDGKIDHDGDGIPSDEEGMNEGRDTDGDGIPDYLDIDDDGDNVPTRAEWRPFADEPVANGYRDTDGDGIPNYLDPDDDGDGVPTRLEVTEGNFSPTANQNAGNTMARFLDPFSTERFSGEVPDILENIILINYRSSIMVQNLQLRNQGGDGEEISFTSKNLGFFTSVGLETLIEPEETEQ